jgi:hypothetical protein
MIRSSLLALSFVAALVCAADDPPIETDGPARITFRRDDSGKVVAVKITPVSSCGPSCKCGAAASELAASPLAQAVQKAARVEVGDSPALTGKAAVIYQGLAARAQVAPVVTWARFHDDAFAEAEATTLAQGSEDGGSEDRPVTADDRPSQGVGRIQDRRSGVVGSVGGEYPFRRRPLDGSREPLTVVLMWATGVPV